MHTDVATLNRQHADLSVRDIRAVWWELGTLEMAHQSYDTCCSLPGQ